MPSLTASAPPAQKRSSKRNEDRYIQVQGMSDNNNSSYAAAGPYGGGMMTTKRIRTPAPHDVLSGRGGGINSHAGNIQFREWVRVRKNAYNLAPSKSEKARVAKQVIDLVKGQEPPGRFLQKDPSTMGSATSGWWTELDDERTMAKTSQALREGAPQIRAAHKDELEEQQQQRTKSKSRRPRKHRTAATTTPETANAASPAVSPKLQSIPEPMLSVAQQQQETPQPSTEQIIHSVAANNAASCHAEDDVENRSMETPKRPLEEQQFNEQPGKRVRVDYRGRLVHPSDATPPLSAVPEPQALIAELPLPPPAEDDFPRLPSPRRLSNAQGLRRSHSLQLSDFSSGDWDTTSDFVNPFEEDECPAADAVMNNRREQTPPCVSLSSPRPGVMRDSIASHGDMGGIGALMRPDSSNARPSSNITSGVRSSSFRNLSCRSLASVLWDMPADSRLQENTTEFMEGMKGIYDALHPDLDEDTIPTHLYPYRGSFTNLRRVSKTSSRGMDGRQ